ncbi:MAG: hypothetical protein E6293_02725 [Dialister sp.]|nr:hypothetical protein [Dialister sp.]
MNDEKIKETAESAILENPDRRIISFSLNGKTYWIKRKLSNRRNTWIKYSAEKEFLYEATRITIAAQARPELVPPVEALTSDYIVTGDSGPSLCDWVENPKLPADRKLHILEMTGEGLAKLHESKIIHGRPALRDITFKNEKITFLDWQSRLYFKDISKQKIQDVLMLLHGLYRENYEEETLYAAALEKGYKHIAGEKTWKETEQLLKKYRFVGKIAKKLNRFHWKDLEAAEKIYAHFHLI